MEYLITYGWAVLVVGIVFLLLLSLKVFDVDWWGVENKVYMTSSFKIPDFKATPYTPNPGTTSVLLFQLINNRGSNVTIWNITVRDAAGTDRELGRLGGRLDVYHCPSSTVCDSNATAFPFNMTAGERFVVNGTMGVPGEMNTVFTTKIQIIYDSPHSSQNHTDTGQIRGRIEP
jgi:hypothetical protein